MRQEKVAVLIVVSHLLIEAFPLSASFDVEGFLFTAFLRKHSGHGQAAELQLGLDTEEALGPVYQRARHRHIDVTELNTLHNFVWLALVV